jgi:hypothetical protein
MDPQDLLAGREITDQWRLAAALIAFAFVASGYLVVSYILHDKFKHVWKREPAPVRSKRRKWFR